MRQQQSDLQSAIYRWGPHLDEGLTFVSFEVLLPGALRSLHSEPLQAIEYLVVRVSDPYRFVPREYGPAISKVERPARRFDCRFPVSGRFCKFYHGQVPSEVGIWEWNARHFRPLEQ